MVCRILRRVSNAQDMNLLSAFIDCVEYNIGIAHNRQLADAGHLTGARTQWKIPKPINGQLNRPDNQQPQDRAPRYIEKLP